MPFTDRLRSLTAVLTAASALALAPWPPAALGRRPSLAGLLVIMY